MLLLVNVELISLHFLKIKSYTSFFLNVDYEVYFINVKSFVNFTMFDLNFFSLIKHIVKQNITV